MEYRRISADCHLDLVWMPPDLFTTQAAAKFRDRMPFVTDAPDGKRWVSKNGSTFGLVGGVGASGTPFIPGTQHRVDAMAATGLYEDGKKGIRRPSDPHLRVKEMDRDGVDAEVIYGILHAASKLQDPEAATEMLRIYNNYLNDLCGHYPQRQIGLANIPYADVDAAVAEVHRCAKLGFRGLELSCSWEMPPTYHPRWEPLWQAVNEVGLPLHFHTFPSVTPKQRAEIPPEGQRAMLFSIITLFNLGLANVLSGLIGTAVFERYPNIRVVFGESGVGWIPFVLDRLDYEWEEGFRDIKLKMKPSDYWRRQCKATFQYDRIGVKLIEDVGVENVMWGCDYPHPDGVWPDSSQFIAEQFGKLPTDVTRKIVCENAGKFYGLIH